MGISLPLYRSQIPLLPEKSIRKFHSISASNRNGTDIRKQQDGNGMVKTRHLSVCKHMPELSDLHYLCP